MSAIQQRFVRGRQQKFFNNNQNNNFVNRRFNSNMQGINARKTFNNAGQGVNGVRQPNRDALIRRNLEHLKQMAQKKRVAQERYYGNGRSPMIKTSSGPFIKQETGNRNGNTFQGRVSVQQRLGNRGVNNIVNSNTKPVFINTRPNTNKVMGTGMRSDKMLRMQSMNNKKRVFRNNGTIKTINSAGKVVYLQPVVKRQPPRQPNNYTVRVQNDRRHHMNHGLNPVLQQEIKMIQNKSRQIISPIAPMQHVQTPPSSVNCDRLPIVTTSRTLHERFSMM